MNKQQLSEPSTEFQEILDVLGDVKLTLEVNILRTYSLSDTGPWPDVSEQDVSVEMRDGNSINLRIYRAQRGEHGEARGPGLVMYHGGGYCLGKIQHEEWKCRAFCRNHGGVAVNVDYRLAPEHLFPVPINDCWDALKWVAANTDRLGFDPSEGFIIGGTSAGANACVVLSLLYRDERPGPPLTGTYLAVPSVVSATNIPERYAEEYVSWEQNKDAPIMDQRIISMFRETYNSNPNHHLASPLLWPTGFHGLPPAYFQVCGMDPLRDDSLIWERILREECGTRTRLDMYPGWPQAFWIIFRDADATKIYENDALNGLKWLVDNKPRFMNGVS